tara:strand:- start:910 stop:1416 length:507 start_codon:yes stop_codon:yes gene_type:complete
MESSQRFSAEIERTTDMFPYLTVRNLLLAGLAGEVSFEIYAWLISPILFDVALAPANLVIALTKIATGLTLPYRAAFVLHFAVGVVGFSAFVLLAHLMTRTKLILSGAIAGVLLWFVAQGLLAPVVGRTFMMGFGAYTQSSFVGHVGMAMIIGYVLLQFESRQARSAV